MLSGQIHPKLKAKLDATCLADCYYTQCKNHRQGCECFVPKGLILHKCKPNPKRPSCQGCNCIHVDKCGKPYLPRQINNKFRVIRK